MLFVLSNTVDLLIYTTRGVDTMARIDIWELRVSFETEEHIWRHHVTPAQLDSILGGPYVVVANRPGLAGSHRLIGRDVQGQCIRAPIVKTEERHVWRVITAWYCKKSEAALLRRGE